MYLNGQVYEMIQQNKLLLIQNGVHLEKFVVYLFINTEYFIFIQNGCLDFIRTDIDRELDESSLTPHQQVFEKMISGRMIEKENFKKRK